MKKAITFLMALIMIIGIAALCVSAEEMVYRPGTDKGFMVGISSKKDDGTTYKELTTVFPNTIVEVKQWKTGFVLTNNSSASIATGDAVRISGANYVAVVKGDVNGDALVNAADYVLVKRFYLGLHTFGEVEGLNGDACAYAAGDTDLDGTIKPIEYLKIKRHVLGFYDLNKDFLVPLTDIEDGESGWTESWV